VNYIIPPWESAPLPAGPSAGPTHHGPPALRVQHHQEGLGGHCLKTPLAQQHPADLANLQICWSMFISLPLLPPLLRGCRPCAGDGGQCAVRGDCAAAHCQQQQKQTLGRSGSIPPGGRSSAATCLYYCLGDQTCRWGQAGRSGSLAEHHRCCCCCCCQV